MSDGFFSLSGTASHIATPDFSAWTGGLDVRAEVAPDDWTPAARNTIAAQYNGTGNQRSWRLSLEFDGDLRWQMSTDGSTFAGWTSTVPVSATDGAWRHVRCTHDPATGTVTFYTSSDGESWSQLGSTVAGTAAVPFNSTADVEIGAWGGAAADFLIGKVRGVEIRRLDTQAVLAAPDFGVNDQSWEDDSGQDPQGHTWTAAGATYTAPTASPPSITSYTADPSTIANGGTSTLTVVAEPGTGGNTLSYSHAVTGGTGSITAGATTTAATLTGAGGASQVTHTSTVTVTEVETGQTAEETVQVVESAPATVSAPTASRSPSTATVGDTVQFSATDDDGLTDAWEWDPGTGITLSSTTAQNPTWDTTGVTPGTFGGTRVRRQVDGVWSGYSNTVSVEVVAAGEAVGEAVTPTVVQAAPAGTAAVLLSFDVEHADGSDLTAAEAANAARAGTFSAPTPLWGAPGDLVARWQVSDDYDPATGDGSWVTVESGVTPGALGIVAGEDRRWTPGRVRYVRARVETTATGAPSAWSTPVAVTPLPSTAWVKPMDDDGGDLGLDVPVRFRNDGAHVRTRQQSVRESLDGTSRSVRTAGLTMRRGSASFLVETPAERAGLLAALDHTGPVLLQFFLDDSGVGEALYVKWQGDDSVARLGNFPADWREVSVGWVEVEAP